MRKKNLHWILWVFVLTACSSEPEVTGTVKDYFGRPVQGVQVAIENSAFNVLTDEDGEYQLEYAPGAFNITFSKDGYSNNKMELNLSTEDKFPAKDTILLKIPDKPGIYFYEEERMVSLVQNNLHQAGNINRALTGIRKLTDNFIEATRPIFIIYGNQYSGKALVINKLRFKKEATFVNLMGRKKTSRVDMWIAGEDAAFKAIPLEADEQLMIVDVDQELLSGHYAISWGGLSIDTPAVVSSKSTDVYDFEYLNPKVYSDLRETAIYLAETIEDGNSKAYTLARIATEVAKAGNQEKADNLFSEAIQTAETIKDGNSKAYALAKIATEIAIAGNQEEAEDLLSKAIQTVGTTKDGWGKAAAFTQIAAEIAKAGDQKKADKLFSQAIQTAETIKDGTKKASALAEIAAEIAKSGDQEKAGNLFSEAISTAETLKDKTLALSNIAIEIAKSGDQEKADILFSKLIQTAETGEYRGKSWVLGSIAAEQAKAGSYDKAIQTTETLKDDYKAIALAKIATEIAKTGDQGKADDIFSKAIQTAETIKDGNNKAYAAIIATEIAIAGNQEKAEDLFSIARLSDKALKGIAVAQAKAGSYDKAIQTVETIKGGNSKVVVLGVIAGELAKPNDYTKEQERRIATNIMEIMVSPTETATETAAALTMDQLMTTGKAAYNTNCAACHQANGAGIPGVFPAITGGAISTGDVAAHIDIVVNGKAGTAMQAFGQQLSAMDLAAIITYERNGLGNSVGDTVQPADVVAAK